MSTLHSRVPARRALGQVLLASASLVGACTSFGPSSVDRVDGGSRVKLSSGSPFALRTEVAGQETACLSHEVTGLVIRRSADTLRMRVTARRPLSASEPAACAVPVSGFVVISSAIHVLDRQIVALPTAVVLMAGFLSLWLLAAAIPTWSF